MSEPKVETLKIDDKKVKFTEQKHPTVADSVAETVSDPFCDENNPRIISFQDVCQAAFMIKGGIDITPCKVSRHQTSLVLGMIIKSFLPNYYR
jgi:hypothetical protein